MTQIQIEFHSNDDLGVEISKVAMGTSSATEEEIDVTNRVMQELEAMFERIPNIVDTENLQN